MSPAIVIIAYNRTESLKRLLGMIAAAHYDSVVSLLISIDQSDNKDIVTIANDFNWEFGEKKVILHDNNLGLRKHILYCGDLTEEYGSLIMLEDDLLVSKSYYLYGKQALAHYGSEDCVAGISLYSYRRTENTLSEFRMIDTGFDTFFMSLPSSWGQGWTEGQWLHFRQWLKAWDGIFQHIPVYIQYWSENSWKKIFAEYLISEGKYFVYPKNSYTSNPGEIGTNYNTKVEYFNTALSEIETELCFSPWNKDSLRYDASFEIAAELLKAANPELAEKDFSVDLNGGKTPEEMKTAYVLTTQRCVSPIQTFSKSAFPLEYNLLNNTKGKGICLCKREDVRFGMLFRILNRIRPYYYTRTKLMNKLKFRFGNKH